MIFVVRMKNIIQRGERFYFRMVVPSDCKKAVGKKEITQSLKTKDPVVAKEKAEKLTKEWKARFEAIRVGEPQPKPSSTLVASDPVEEFRQKMVAKRDDALKKLFRDHDDEELKLYSEHFRGEMESLRITKCSNCLGLPELGFDEAWKPHKDLHIDRQLRNTLIAILQSMREAIDTEIGYAFSKELDADCLEDYRPPRLDGQPAKKAQLASPSNEEETDLIKVMELMIASKKRITKTKNGIRVDVGLLKEWTGKSDITTYTKADLVDYVKNCLPYIPANKDRGSVYKGKSLKACVRLTKKDPEKYPPITHKTCENRLTYIQMVFRYAKDELGVIRVNPASNVDIPEVRVAKKGAKYFTAKELKTLWKALKTLQTTVNKRPSRYWVPVLSLYHGFRLNEICGLFTKDVYEDEDGILVIDINADGGFKSVKNKASVRVVPVHPYVADQLGFRAFVDKRKSEVADGLLFSDIKGNATTGYRAKTSKWFGEWKKTWLKDQSMHKNFHSLRYTFIRTAQNDAEMSDRCAQEITGHSVTGVSDVHLAYSGKLKPEKLLKELSKVKYGWE